MSAAAARRRKQLAARKAEEDVVLTNLEKILLNTNNEDATTVLMSEETAYEALQLAQSVVRKRIKCGQYAEACDVAYRSCLALLQRERVSVASQLLDVLAEALRETHTDATEEWIERTLLLHQTHQTVMNKFEQETTTEQATTSTTTDQTSAPTQQQQQQQQNDPKQLLLQKRKELTRLYRLQSEWLRKIVQWSAELGTTRFGHVQLHQALGHLCWKLTVTDFVRPLLEKDEIAELQCDAVQYMVLAEQPTVIVDWLSTLPKPTTAQTKVGHGCAPALRDALFTRAVLFMTALENLRDANKLLQDYATRVEERNLNDLAKSYTNKEDGKAPSHVMFAVMLLRICEKDVRTGPLFSWLQRSFKREIDLMYKPQVPHSFMNTIGKVYFQIQPPPSMLSMMENMMGMMGGGGGGMPPAGINPAMMQAALAQMQGMK